MGVLTYNCKTKKTEYRDFTPEEIMEIEERAKVENLTTLPSDSERIKILEAALLELAEVIANG